VCEERGRFLKDHQVDRIGPQTHARVLHQRQALAPPTRPVEIAPKDDGKVDVGPRRGPATGAGAEEVDRRHVRVPPPCIHKLRKAARQVLGQRALGAHDFIVGAGRTRIKERIASSRQGQGVA
jgi:hypothetical protein